MNKNNKSVEEKMSDNLKIVLSQYMSDHKSLTVKRGMLNRAKNGYAITRPPLGYSKTETPGIYELNENGLAARSALQHLANGKTNVGMVVAYLGMFYHVMTGIEHSGTAWLDSIMLDPYYVGLISYKSQLYPGLHEPLITLDEHEKLLEIIIKDNDSNSLESFDKNL